MSSPNHYSRELVRRCQNLIDDLLPIIDVGLPNDSQFGGPLRTTFLLAMATPMVTLPIERIFKPGTGTATAGDDRKIDEKLSDAVADAFGPRKTFENAPFAQTSRWSYVANCTPFNIADGLPTSLLEALATPDAITSAKTALTSRILRDLRNALAHGAVVYLDKDGMNSDGPAAMLAFVGTRMKDYKITAFNVLRVSEHDFCTFLKAWTEWIKKSSVVVNELNSKSPFGNSKSTS